MLGQKLVADVMKVADERHGDAPFEQPLLDVGDGGGRLIAIDRDAYEFGAGAGQRRHLPRGTLDIGRIRIGHRLHDDRRPAAHRDAANLNRDSFVSVHFRTHQAFHAIRCQTDIAGRA
jgi:hypothetical protein